MGSRSKLNKAYIAGFLDGDGSLMLQIKKRQDSKIGFRFMATIALYQDSRHEEPLRWIQGELGIGYVSKRNDGMSELRVNGYKAVRDILSDLSPYVRFKKVQAQAMVRACEILESTKFSKLDEVLVRELIDLVLLIQNENYRAHRKRTRSELYESLGLTP